MDPILTAAVEAIWAISKGATNIKIAVLDSAVDIDHPCFGGAALYTLIDDPAASTTPSEHGTSVASVLFANHDSPIQGLAPACSGLLIPIYERSPITGALSCSQEQMASAIRLAVNNSAHIINISGGQLTPATQTDLDLRNAVQYALDNKVLVVAAAGNDGCDCVHVPASIPGVLVAGAANSQGQPMPFSNYGNEYHREGLLVPAHHVQAAGLNGTLVQKTSTSIATPIVGGRIREEESLRERERR